MRNPNKSQGKVRDLNSSSREGNSYDQNNISALKNSLQKRKSENSRPNTRAFDEDSESFRRGRGDGPSRRSLLQTSKSTRGFSVSNAIREAKLNETAKPVYFNVMIVGEENLGKSDFLDKFLSQVYNSKKKIVNKNSHKITEYIIERNEGGLRYVLNLIDSPGWNASNRPIKDWYVNIKDYLTKKMTTYKD